MEKKAPGRDSIALLEMGAADFIAKPVSPPVVLARVKTHLRMKNLSDQLRHNAATDSLTGIANRRQFDEKPFSHATLLRAVRQRLDQSNATGIHRQITLQG